MKVKYILQISLIPCAVFLLHEPWAYFENSSRIVNDNKISFTIPNYYTFPNDHDDTIDGNFNSLNYPYVFYAPATGSMSSISRVLL